MNASVKGLVFALLVMGAALSAQEAVIQEISGTVEVKAPGSEGWAQAQVGQTLSGDTQISTGFKSSALVSLGNSILTVRALTRLTLAELANIQGSETVDLYLQSGRVRADVTPPSGGTTDFRIRSPSVTASVRGTRLEFDGTNLWVAEGRVHLRGDDGAGLYVGAGHRAASNPYSGRTLGGQEMAREELAPPLPNAARETGAAATAGKGAGSGRTTPAGPEAEDPADIGVGLTWN